MSEGLSQPSVITITEDALGRMWFGTREGINIYDGNVMTSYKGWFNDPLTGSQVWMGNEVRTIIKDGNNNILCLIDNDVIQYDPASERFHRITNGKDVTALTQHDGEAILIANNSLYIKKDAESDSLTFQFTIPSLPSVSSLTVTDSMYYICTVKGLYAFNREKKHLNVYLQDASIYSAFEGSNGDMWISSTSGGLYHMTKGQAPELVSVPTVPDARLGAQQTRDAVEDEYGRIWYGAFTGLFCYDPSSGSTRHIEMPTNVGGLTHPSIFAMYRDSHGTIWAGSYYGGVNYFTPRHDQFINYNYDGYAPEGLYHSFIIDMAVDNNGHLWFGTDGAGICRVDSLWNIKEQITSRTPGKALRQNNIKTMAFDKQHNRLYIGTHLGGLSCYDINTQRMTNFIDTAHEGNDPGNIIHHLKIHNGYLYISSRSGLFRMNLDTRQISKINVDDISTLTFDINANGELFMHNDDSIIKITVQPDGSAEQSVITHYNRLSDPMCIHSTASGLFFSSLGNGLYHYDLISKRLKHYTTSNSDLPSDYCYNIQSGTDGKVFITTDRSVACHNPADSSFVDIEFSSIFPESHIIAECGLLVNPDGSVLVGSTKGITTLTNDMFSNLHKADSSTTDFYFSHLTVLNREIRPNDKSGVTTCALPYARTIRLRHDQNNFSLYLTLCDYINTNPNRLFKYKLEGVDNTWLTSDDGEIHYTNLDPGHYTLRARHITDTESREIRLNVIVEHPWYATWWAWLIYLSLAASLAYYLVTKGRATARLKRFLKKERMEKQQIEKLNHEKLVFFTNVSHEFQTPLTLIMSHIDLLTAKYARHTSLLDSLRRIRGHAEQMSHLITQLLEFRKLQQNHHILHIARHNAFTSLHEVTTPFTEYARQRNITFTVDEPDSDITGFYDAKMISRVLVNIISNAFKYTPDGGRIHAKVTCLPNGSVSFRVSDTGKGIEPKDISYVFDRFYNGSSDETGGHGLNYKSTGIGLAFAKSIVDKHHGNISVESEPGQGSTFTVTLPGDISAFEKDSNVVFDKPDTATDAPEMDEEGTTSAPISATADSTGLYSDENQAESADVQQLPTLLIVEDNDELRNNLHTFFSQYYQVECAENGAEGLEKTRELNPDIIISDIMMPEMNGTDMCRAIKTDINLCHIPVILLTALSSTEHNLEGLNANADDYITKPFESRLLLARVDNLLRNRRLLRKQFDKQPISEIDLTVVNPMDRDLLNRTSQLIDRYMADSELDIPLLCRELGISRSLFYNKFKSLTGMTPNSFILNYRLKYAATLFTAQPHISIAEVADRTGFSTTAYFSRCFKKQFGVPPQQFQKEAKTGGES